MLKTFLKDNKISLTRLTSPVRPQPNSAQTIPQHQCPLPEKTHPQSEPVISIGAVRSPTHKRRKIFQPISSPESKITAEFPQLPNFSTVQAYQIPQDEPRGKTPKRKMKVNKENGLCLARVTSKDLLREISRRELQQNDPESQEQCRNQTNEHLQSLVRGEGARQRRVQELERYNRGLQRELKEGKRIEDGSLVIEEAASDFTFQSSTSPLSLQSSLSYSNSFFPSRSRSPEASLHFSILKSPLDMPLRV